MGKIVLKDTGGSGVSVPAGTHLAVCYRIVDIGRQPDTGFGEKPKISIAWEIPGETIDVNGKQMPLTISRTYANSLNPKATLRLDLEKWRGKAFTKEELAGFELGNVLGKPCLITVEVGENGKTRVVGVASIVKGMTAPKPVHPLVEYSITDGKNAVYNDLPEWLRRACDECMEWQKPKANPTPESASPATPVGDDVPF